MRIFIGSDHGGFQLKERLVKYLLSCKHEVINYGCFNTKSCDYPDIANEVCLGYSKDVEKEENKIGILICGTGVGISMAANKYSDNIRCALCNNPYLSILSRQHNNANFLALGARVVAYPLAEEIVSLFLATEFTNEERHIRRIEKLSNKTKNTSI